ncbi:peptide chain release factor-like protein [Candidatus Peregrinibacteria bacterium]|nr:peptide chain release factor-like protein [Candidatus Peregrinibacteria bacterium]MBI3816034.1 peptide chain release factor-like protein [Candidatus Peregrinibacteria bacterium]
MEFPIPLPSDLLAAAARLGIRTEDVEEQFTRSRGPGGQNVNKRSTAVMLHHIPTGIIVRMQANREQSVNRLKAWTLLILKIEEKIRGKESTVAREQYRVRMQKKRRSRKAQEKMLMEKKRRGERKKLRAVGH